MTGEMQMDTINQLQECIDYLMLPEAQNKTEYSKKIIQSLDYIGKLNTNEISPNIRKIAELFFLCIQKLHEKSVDSPFSERITTAFENIRNYNGDINDSYVSTIHFLSQIYHNNKTFEYSNEMKASFSALYDKLDKIRFIFGIRKDDTLVFPIGKLLDIVINDDTFFNGPLDIDSICTLLLALEIFDMNDYTCERKKIDNLITKHNLKCLEYLKSPTTLKVGGDSCWKENFQQNSSLTLFVRNGDSYSIYIRHPKKNYFDKSLQNVQIEEEINSKKEAFAYFCLIPLCRNETPCSFNDLMHTEDLTCVENICKTLFVENKRNVFLENSFIKTNGEIKTSNPFVANDYKIVLNENTAYKSDNKSLLKTLKSYSLCKIGEKFDFVLMSSIFLLLSEDSSPISKIFGLLKEDSDNLQSSVITEWFNSIDDLPGQINTMQTNYFDSIKYAKSRSGIEGKSFKDIKWLPYKFPEEIIPNYIHKNKSISCNSIVKIKKFESFEDVFYKDEKDNDILVNEIFFPENESITGVNFYAYKTNDGYRYDSEIDRLWKIQNKIQDDNNGFIEAKDLSSIDNIELGEVISTIKLHEKALCENICDDFDAVAHFRLLNHLLFCNIPQKNNWSSFYNLFKGHEVLRFDKLKSFVPELDNEQSLIIPKENSNTDNILVSILNNYGRFEGFRNRDIFNRRLILDKECDAYCIEPGKRIEEVVILFDTLQRGSSTKDVLEAYLGGKNENGRICKILCENKPLSITEIVNKNKIPLKIKFIYGTAFGEEEIKKFLKERKFSPTVQKTTIVNRISKIADDLFIGTAKDLYGNINIQKDYYPIIREFNQPKKNVFSDNLLKPTCIAAIFVKKKELEM